MSATDRSLAFILAFGVLGGGSLITTVSVTNRGPMIFLPYAAIVLVCAAMLRADRVQPFRRRFALHFGAFMASTAVLYLFIGAIQARSLTSIPLLGHAWRIGMMTAIAMVLSLAVAQLSATRQALP
jgi:hypothetical protein